MGRVHLFEFGDQAWCPKIIRRAITEYLATATKLTRLFQPTAAVLSKLLKETSEDTILVIGAGSGGGILDVFSELPPNVKVILTDIFPDQDFQSDDKRISYRQDPVDALHLPNDLPGIWVMYSTFHHFRPLAARKILESAVATRRPIAIFEAAPRTPLFLITTLLMPLMVLILTPFIRPFRWSRLLFTYLIPIYPLLLSWDGLVSNLRTYGIQELNNLTAELQDYEWDVRNLKGNPVISGLGLPALIGKPIARS